MPRLWEFYPGICLTTEEKARRNLSQGKKTLSQVKKNLRVQYTYYQNTHTHTHERERENIKPPQYKLKQTQCKIYPNEIVGNWCPAVCLYASCPKTSGAHPMVLDPYIPSPCRLQYHIVLIY